MDDTEPTIDESMSRLRSIIPATWLVVLVDAIRETQARTRYGSITIIIADGRIVGIDREIKTR